MPGHKKTAEEEIAETYGLGETWHGEGTAAYQRCRRRNGTACDMCKRGHAVENGPKVQARRERTGRR